MKGAVLITKNPDIPAWAYAVLTPLADTATLTSEGLQVRKDGHLFTIHRDSANNKIQTLVPEWDELKDKNELADYGYAFAIDCRQEDLFCRLVIKLAGSDPNGLFVLDNSGTILSAKSLQPSQIKL